MTKELRILILEDVPTYAELMEQELRKAGIAFSSRRVDTREDFIKGIEDFCPDLILADYKLPSFDGISALEIVKEKCPDVPFIFVTGVMGEEWAVGTLKRNAADYVLKDRIFRLASVVQRALQEANERTKRKQLEERQKLVTQVPQLLNQPSKKIDKIRDILYLIKEFTGFEVVGIRLREGEDFPYYFTSGFPSDFVEAERYLCARDQYGRIILDSQGRPYLECMCGNVIQGRTNPSKPFFTEGGSFWTNSTTELLASTSEEDREARTRNRCNTAGYESVGLIPLRFDTETIGLLQLNDSRKGMFTSEMMSFFEGIGATVGIDFARKQAEDALKARLDEIEQMNRLMVGRELKMEEMRKEIQRLKSRIEELEKR